jgi:hypothetical protein
MRGAIPPLPNTLPWRGAQLKKKAQGQLYLYLYLDWPFALWDFMQQVEHYLEKEM